MGRPRIYDTPHFCLHTYVRKGHTYVEAYGTSAQKVGDML